MHRVKANQTFIAIDFETADYRPDSACAIGMAKIINMRIVDKFYSLIRPPRKKVYFTHIHKLTWNDLIDAPTFSELWPAICNFTEGIDYFIAHNASFDSRILTATCTTFGITPPQTPFICTLQNSRRLLNLPSHSLDYVCTHLGISLHHHHAVSDALAAAEIFLYLAEVQSKLLDITKNYL